MKVSPNVLTSANFKALPKQENSNIAGQISSNPQIEELRAYHTPNIHFGRVSDRAGVGLRRRKQDELPPELKKDVDEIVATFTTCIHPSVPDKVFQGTVKGHIASVLSGNRQMVNRMAHHATSEGSAKSIVNNGFNFDKYSSAKTGPGAYFTESSLWGQTMCGPTVVSANIRGDAESIDSRFFENILGNKEFMSKFEETLKGHGVKMSSDVALAKYVRQLIADDFELDMLITSIGGGTHYVIYNPDSIGSLRIDPKNQKIDGIPSDYYRY